jgi:hypothetical protein
MSITGINYLYTYYNNLSWSDDFKNVISTLDNGSLYSLGLDNVETNEIVYLFLKFRKKINNISKNDYSILINSFSDSAYNYLMEIKSAIVSLDSNKSEVTLDIIKIYGILVEYIKSLDKSNINRENVFDYYSNQNNISTIADKDQMTKNDFIECIYALGMLFDNLLYFIKNCMSIIFVITNDSDTVEPLSDIVLCSLYTIMAIPLYNLKLCFTAINKMYSASQTAYNNKIILYSDLLIIENINNIANNIDLTFINQTTGILSEKIVNILKEIK